MRVKAEREREGGREGGRVERVRERAAAADVLKDFWERDTLLKQRLELEAWGMPGRLTERGQNGRRLGSGQECAVVACYRRF